MTERIDVLGVGFDNLTLAQATDRACQLVDADRNHMVVTPNSEIVYMTKADPGLRDVLNSADLVVPDGIGVIKAAISSKPRFRKRWRALSLERTH